MDFLRTLLVRHRALAILLVAIALCLKVTMPAGYMVGHDTKLLSLQMCDAATGHGATKQVIVPKSNGGDTESGSAWQDNCAYSSLSVASTAATHPTLLLIAIAFILLLGFAPIRITARERNDHIWPPLRGPPSPT